MLVAMGRHKGWQKAGTMKLGGDKRKQMGGGAGHAGIRNVGSERETRCR